MPLLSRRQPAARQRPQPMQRALTASATVIDLGNKQEAKVWGKVRPGWQSEAWAYRRNLGELRYACAYLGNSAMRIRLYAGAYVPDNETPIAVSQAPEVPDDLRRAAEDTMLRLAGGGPLALAMMQKKLTEHFEIGGETFLVGETDPLTGLETWGLRSTSELVISHDGTYKVLEYPGATSRDARELDPHNTFVSRLWWPDPEWGMLADSPVRSILDLCEELLLLGKDVRATARSRLAMNGILGIPDTLSIVGANPESAMDPNSDPFMQTLIQTVTSALTNEGSAASVVPLLLRGPADALNAIKHITIDRPDHDSNIAARTELIARIATGIDLPAEVLTGKAALNHWSAWAVSDDTFRHHIEPLQVVENDALTAGFMWPILDSFNTWDPALIRKVLVWHDPTELVTHPDRSADAFQAWDRFAISDGALRDYLGFPDTDQPGSTELLTRIVTKARTLDPALVETILKRLDPTLPDQPPPPTTPPMLPAGPVTPPAPPTPQAGPPAGASIGGGAAATGQFLVEAMAQGVAAAFGQGVFDRESITLKSDPAAFTPGGQITAGTRYVRGSYASRLPPGRVVSRKLAEIDRRLRDRLHVAVNIAVKRALERAGARVVSKAKGRGAEAVRASIENVDTYRVCGTVGPAVVAALGLDAHALATEAFTELEQQWTAWVEDAQDQALRQVARLTGLDFAAVRAQVGIRLKDDAEAGWEWIQDRAGAAVTKAMSHAPVSAEVVFSDTDNFVSMGEIRTGVGISGGYLSDPFHSGLTDDGRPADPSQPMGQIGTGDTISGVLEEQGFTDAGYEWSHGAASNPFEPHVELDGVQFQTFTDDVLANPDSFPAYDYYTPGDHDGCSCDFYPLWEQGEAQTETGGEAQAASAAFDFNEDQHPRGDGGRFEPTGGQGGSAAQTAGAAYLAQGGRLQVDPGNMPDQQTMAQIHTSFGNLSQEYPSAMDQLDHVVIGTPHNPAAAGCYDFGTRTITLNAESLNNPAGFQDTWDAARTSGWSAGSAGGSAVEQAITHETGHHLEGLLWGGPGPEPDLFETHPGAYTKMWGEIGQAEGMTSPDAAWDAQRAASLAIHGPGISQYAATSSREFVAEAFVDSKFGSSPSPVADVVGKTFAAKFGGK